MEETRADFDDCELRWQQTKRSEGDGKKRMRDTSIESIVLVVSGTIWHGSESEKENEKDNEKESADGDGEEGRAADGSDGRRE